ncbi:hypothetical protein GCM10017562_50810 [Streptomyces roseofulvus]|uniref:hypothetical protein n=1 Tax=Streptomyces roseofulvus TaxID=33902 RepID=UPI0031FC6D43
MGEETPRTLRDPLAAPPCSACGRPRATVATRHKVLGAWVPEWKVQPCRNPDCPLFEAPAPDGAEATEAPAPDATQATQVPAPDGTEATTTQVTGKNGENGRSPAPG